MCCCLLLLTCCSHLPHGFYEDELLGGWHASIAI